MKIIDYFREITKIPHCSNATSLLNDFLVSFSNSKGYSVEVDEAGNILASSQNPKLCLQAHYDMVCVGKAPDIEVVEEDGWLKAKDSSLGADNGMAIAMMMALMDDKVEGEFLWTNDEEVGLKGAEALKFDLRSKYMLNLDSEDEAEVYIGCAGGADIKASKKYERELRESDFYEVKTYGLSGGHSGVDIDKDIPNAIKLFASYVDGKGVKIAHIKGGERLNSIPVGLRAIVCSDEKISSGKNIDFTRFGGRFQTIKRSDEIIELLNRFQNGVLEQNSKLQIPNSSINLALISFEDETLTIEASARAMDNETLEKVTLSTKEFFESYGYSVEVTGRYAAWQPQMSEFAKIVDKKMKKVFDKSSFKAIHAGLECGIISSIYPHMQIVSIGPNIEFPHSVKEKVEIESVKKIYKVVKKIIKELKE